MTKKYDLDLTPKKTGFKALEESELSSLIEPLEKSILDLTPDALGDGNPLVQQMVRYMGKRGVVSPEELEDIYETFQPIMCVSCEDIDDQKVEMHKDYVPGFGPTYMVQVHLTSQGYWVTALAREMQFMSIDGDHGYKYEERATRRVSALPHPTLDPSYREMVTEKMLEYALTNNQGRPIGGLSPAVLASLCHEASRIICSDSFFRIR